MTERLPQNTLIKMVLTRFGAGVAVLLVMCLLPAEGIMIPSLLIVHVPGVW